jgi:serine protease inhibitor
MRTYRFQKQSRARQSNSKDLEFLSADRLFFSPDISLNKCLKNFLVNELETLDFQRQADASRRQINAWVEDVTRNMIKELLAPGTITAQTHSVLANAAYFKGKWETTFDSAKTTNEFFYPILLEPTKIPMMSVKGQFQLCKFKISHFEPNFNLCCYLSRAKCIPGLSYSGTTVRTVQRNPNLNVNPAS